MSDTTENQKPNTVAPLPFRVQDYYWLNDSEGNRIASVERRADEDGNYVTAHETARFIVRACNAHGALLDALQLAESIINAVEADHDEPESPALAKIRAVIAEHRKDSDTDAKEPIRVPRRLFDRGRIVATPGALAACKPDHLRECLGRHLSGDWGCVCDEDRKSNFDALFSGGRILSSYPIDPAQPCNGFGENTLWIITEGDRSATTFLLPSEY